MYNLILRLMFQFVIRDEHIAEKCGTDSVYYAMFQRRIILYMLIITVLGVSILLPIHLTENMSNLINRSFLVHIKFLLYVSVKKPLHFAKTSVANLPAKYCYF